MSGIPGGQDRRADPNGPAPSEVEALLVATLVERADDVGWDPALADVTSLRRGRPAGGDGRGGPVGGVGPRRVPAAVAWLSAAAAVVLVAVGATAMLGGGQDRGLPVGPVVTPSPQELPASATVRRELPVRFAGATPTRPVYATCAEVPTSTDDPRMASKEAVPNLTYDPWYTPGAVGDGRPTGTASDVPVAVTTTVPTEAAPTQTPGDQADLVATRLGQALDDGRFAELSYGPGVVVVHVVRGVDEAGARALVESCSGPGVDVRVQLVDRSEAQLHAVERDAAANQDRLAGAGSGYGVWIDTHGNRVLLGVERMPTAEQRAWCAQRYGGVVAYYVQTPGVVVEAVA